MRREELKTLSWLKKETEYQERKLEELTARAEGARQVFSHLPKGKTAKDTMGDMAAEIADLRKVIQESHRKYYREVVRMETFIESLPDSEMRLLLRMRFMDGLSWEKIGDTMGYDQSTVRKKYGRFIRTDVSEQKYGV